jgi:GMP synthase (glutamine-hydrolysing)
VFCELYPCNVTATILASKNIKGVILSGGPASVYEDQAPHADESFWSFATERSLPVLGVCYGAQEMVFANGGIVERASVREFGPAVLNLAASRGIFEGIPVSSQVRALCTHCGGLNLAHPARPGARSRSGCRIVIRRPHSPKGSLPLAPRTRV